MRSKFIYFILALSLTLTLAAEAENNLIVNPMSADATMDWFEDYYQSDNSQFDIETDENGDACLTVQNFMPNDARWIQTIPVEPLTTYVFRCKIKTENCEYNSDSQSYPSQGATLGVLNTNARTESIYATTDWVEVEFYGTTVAEQRQITIAARLGGNSAMGVGKAWFKDIVVMKAVAPDDAIPVSLATFAPYVPPSFSFLNSNGEPKRYTQVLALAAFAMALAGLALITHARRLKRQAELKQESDSLAAGFRKYLPVSCLTLILLLGFTVRAYIALNIRGYVYDMNCFMAWGEGLKNDGWAFYEKISFCDYPPLYIIFLAMLDAVRSALGFAANSPAHILFIKLAPIFADLAFAAFAYAMFRRVAGYKRALLLALAIAFNPAYIADGSAWGQMDSVLAFMLALCVYFAVKGKWHIALPLFALSVLTKPQALLFGPVGLAYLLVDCVRNRENCKYLLRALYGAIGALALMYAVAAPFAIYSYLQSESSTLGVILSPVKWLIKLYGDTFGGYRYISLNACNLYTLLAKNLVPLEQTPTLETISWVLFWLSYAYAAALAVFSKDRRSLSLIGATLICLLYSFAPMMHERYLFPVIALALLAYIEYRDWRLLCVIVSASVTSFLNMGLILQGAQTADFSYLAHLQSSEYPLIAVISAINVITALFLAWTAIDIAVFKRTHELKSAQSLPDAPAERLRRRSDWRLHMRLKDYALMGAVTLIYAAVAFANLGDTQAPQTYYTSSEYLETITYDLGSERDFRFTYYAGITSGNFTVALSNDGERWTDEVSVNHTEGKLYQWQWFSPTRPIENIVGDWSGSGSFDFSGGTGGEARAEETVVENLPEYRFANASSAYPLQNARYIRLSMRGLRIPLYEVGFIDVANNVLLPVESVYGSVEGADYQKTVDEQEFVAFTPSYMNGMYFDEIYHARTAFEFQNGLSVLEWSHPHLGKIFIMFGIRLFGMTPFGWRCMGALMGVLMLPAMYLIIKQLTKKTNLAFLGMFLLSVDSMHFTQTRIATVDSYAVLFIMLMYFFMFRYLQMNIHKDSFARSLVPLGLSGLCFGLGCASKWIGIYAGAGLAVLFFISMCLRAKEYVQMRKTLKASQGDDSDSAELARSVRMYPFRLIMTLLFCVLVFVVIPVVIYYFSYYWHMKPDGGITVKKVWDMQVQMYNYHKGQANDTHMFRSPWYEWPTIVRPMWYYSADINFVGRGYISSISCMGNPAVWWTGCAAFISMLLLLVGTTRPKKAYLWIAIGLASQFVPWLFVGRSTFIYHYFASVPFIIIATVLMIHELRRADRRLASVVAYTLMFAALALFIMFYPLESGFTCAYEYAQKLRWFNWTNYMPQ